MEDENKNSAGVKKVIDLNPHGRQNVRAKLFQFEKNDQLLGDTARIKGQRDIINERIALMQEHSPHVSKSVFEKVRRDYLMQLESINILFNEKKLLLKKELKDLYLLREKLSVEITRHKEILEEAQFRQLLNEFSLAQYQEVESFENKEIGQFEADISTAYQLIRLHEDLFDPDDLGLPKKTSAESVSEVTKTAHVVLPKPLQETQTAYRPTTPEAVKPPAPAQPVTTQKTALPEPPQEMPKLQPEPEKVKVSLLVTEQKVEPEADLSASFDDLFIDDNDKELDSLAESKNNIKKLLDEEHELDIKAAVTPTTPKIDLTPQVAEKLATQPDDDDLSLEALLSEESASAPSKSDDYFQQDKVSESSYSKINLTDPGLQAPIDDDDEPTAPIPPKPDATNVNVSLATPEKPDISSSSIPARLDQSITLHQENPAPAKVLNPDDSISNILDSIKIDGEDAESASAVHTTPQGSPGDYYLKSIDGDLDIKEYVIKENLSIGRSPSNDITLKAPKVSRQHAAINRYNNQFIIIDLKSSNGVFVNGAKVDEYVLKVGDEVSVGGYRFLFHKKS